MLMITLTYDKIMTLLTGFTILCVAVGWLIKIIKAIKKPNDDINAKLDRDNKRIQKLEDDTEYLKDAMAINLRCNMVMLSHMRTNNTGEIAKQEEEVNRFLTKR